LDKGEVLQALGPRQTLGGKSWYQIAPPSGEFRWVRRDELKREMPEQTGDAAPRELPLTADARPLSGSAVAPPAADDGVQPAVHAKAEIPLHKLGEQGSMETFPIPEIEEDSEVAPAAAEEPQEQAPVDESASGWTVVERTDQPPAPPKPPVEMNDVAHQLAVLNLQLSQTVLRPMGQWHLDGLRDRVENIAHRATDPSMRDQATALLRRIGEFDRLEQRHLEITQAEPEKSEADAAKAQMAFTGEGWLVPVITSRTDLPHFALTDDHGKILHFVTSQPGLNLRRYTRRRVGIVGTREENPSTKRPQVLASRVVLLDRHDVGTR
jgi:hypothetical protein